MWSGAPPALLDDVVETLLASIPAAGGWCKGGGLTVVTLGAILRRGSQVYLASADVGHDAYSVILTWEEPTAEPPPGPPAETAAQFWATVTARVAAAASPAAPPPAPAAAAPAAVAAAPPGQRELWLVVSRQRPATWFISHDEVLDIAHPQAWLLWRGNPVLLPDTLLPPLLAVLVSAQDWHLDAGPASTLLPQVQAGQSASLAHCFLAPQNSAYYVQLTWTAPNIPLEPPANIAAICAGLRTALVRLPLMHYLLSLVDHPAPPSGRTLANNQTRVIFPLLTTPPHHPGGPTRNGSAPAQHKEEDYP